MAKADGVPSLGRCLCLYRLGSRRGIGVVGASKRERSLKSINEKLFILCRPVQWKHALPSSIKAVPVAAFRATLGGGDEAGLEKCYCKPPTLVLAFMKRLSSVSQLRRTLTMSGGWPVMVL